MKKEEKSEFNFDYLDNQKKKFTKETNFLSEEIFSFEEDKKFSEDISSNQLIKIFNGENKENDSAELELSDVQKNKYDNQNIIEQEQYSIHVIESKINEKLNEVRHENVLVLQQNQIKTPFVNQHYNIIPAKMQVNQDILRQQERNIQNHPNTQKILGKKRKKDNKLLNVSESKINNKENKKSNLGRKKKGDNTQRKHNKFMFDNKTKKVKRLYKDALLEFINTKIRASNISFYCDEKEYKGKEVKLLNIKDEQIVDTSIVFNRNLFKKTIKDFLKVEISKEYNNYPHYFNDKIITEIYNSEKGANIRNILDMTFLEGFKYYRMDKDVYTNPKYSCLKGLENSFLNLENLLKKYEQEYINEIKELIKTLEIIYQQKIPRKQ